MIRVKKIAVFYRDIPAALDHLVHTDTKMKLLKDGVFTCNGVQCPRATITMEWTGSDTDVQKIKKIKNLLEELADNNQIVSFTIR